MKRRKSVTALILGFILCMAFSCQRKAKQVEEPLFEPDWTYAQNHYKEHISLAMEYLDSLKEVEPKTEQARYFFKKTRAAFKVAEPYASYLNPPIGHRVNGPALPIFLEDTERVMHPIGLQKLEETIYEGGEPQEVFVREVLLTKGLLSNLQKNLEKRSLNPKRFFIATHQQLLRIISLSISGFDTPISYLGFAEAKVSLLSLEDVYSNTLEDHISALDPKLNERFKNDITDAVAFLERNQDFESFDRFSFIRDHMNPITRDWVAIRKASGLWEGVNNKPFNFDAPTFFEKDAFNLEYFRPVINRKPSEDQILLGEKLFFDPKLSAGGDMACATCHIPEKAYSDGMISNLDNEGRPLERNTPTLINAAFQKSFFWDGRSATLLDQISSVFTNEKEFDSNVHQFSDAILADSTYTELFDKAYGDVPKKNREVIRAISSYISTLNGFNSKFDKNIRGEEDSFTAEEKLGFNLYMGKALCATCHFIPLTNGTVPPFFTETEKEVIGVPADATNTRLDEDEGFYWRWKKEIHWGMFKTPTVRNSELTAPYMHNGVYETLEDVMDFYNKGGGGGLGFDLEHQTLPFDKLELSEEELSALVSFVKTLTDTEVADY